MRIHSREELNRTEEAPVEDRREHQAAIEAFHEGAEGLAPGTVVGYSGKFTEWFKFRHWSRATREVEFDLFLADTGVELRRKIGWTTSRTS